MLTEEEIKKVWNYVNQGSDFPWPKSSRQQRKLAQSLSNIIGKAEIELSLCNLDRMEFNTQIRSLISPVLKAGIENHSTKIGIWIVREWGGIKNGNEAIEGWIQQLGRFEDNKINNFIVSMKTTRISSWSKIIAFADPINHAIYDARTAIALNCALLYLGSKFRFFIPLSQNRRIASIRKNLLPTKSDYELGYAEYIDLLKQLAKHNILPGGILLTEMTLFSNAPLLAERLDTFNNSPQTL